jgi:hypothetical protein
MSENATMTDELVEHVLQNLDESGLSEWETGFLKNVRLYWKKHRTLSIKQQKRLREIWDAQHNAKS